MKIKKNKIVFSLVVLCILLFMGGYYVITFGNDKEPTLDKNQLPVPELEDEQKQYESKLEALEDLKEEKVRTAPSLYPDHMIDDNGYVNPDYLELEKQRIIDSIYQGGPYPYETVNSQVFGKKISDPQHEIKDGIPDQEETFTKEVELIAKDQELGHQLFFASGPTIDPGMVNRDMDAQILAQVDGTQIVKQAYRLRMRLTKAAMIRGKRAPRNTYVYGLVSFRSNRVMIEIENIDDQPVKLDAYDLQDGMEGIYVVNNFRSEASDQVTEDMVDDVNIAGIPQIRGIKKIFQRNHRTTKVTITNKYQLILKRRQ